MAPFVERLRGIPYGQSLVATVAPTAIAQSSNALLDALSSAPPGTPLPEVLAGLAPGAGGRAPGAGFGGVLYDVETLPGEDKYRTGPQVGKKFPPGITPRKAYPDPTGDPFENLKQFLTLFYCCYDITGNFTLLGEPIPGGDGVDIKAAMIVEIEEGKDNPVPPHPKHVSGYLDGSKLNDALKARKGAETDWDDVDVTFTLKPGVATSTESVPPSGSDLARRFAREQPEFKLERIVFTDRRTKMKAKYPDRKPK